MPYDLFTMEDARTLASHDAYPAVSLHLPTHRVSVEAQEDKIRLRNLLRSAEKNLSGKGMRHVQDFLAPGYDLLPDTNFWRYLDAGLSLFLAENRFFLWRTPLALQESLHVGRYFQIKPLLPLLSGNALFFLLSLTQNEVAVYRCTRESMEPVDVDDVPESLAHALRFDEREAQLQFHTKSVSPSGKRPAVFHGMGIGTDDTKDRILRFCQAVNKGMRDFLTPSGAPLIVAADKGVLPIYVEANTYPGLVAPGVAVNPAGMTVEQLHTEAWKAAEATLLEDQRRAADAFRQQAGTSLAAVDLAEILRAGVQGRIDALFVDHNAAVYGRFDPQSLSVDIHGRYEPEDQELLNQACLLTLNQGGKVFALPAGRIPGGGDVPAAAVFRF